MIKKETDLKSNAQESQILEEYVEQEKKKMRKSCKDAEVATKRTSDENCIHFEIAVQCGHFQQQHVHSFLLKTVVVVFFCFLFRPLHEFRRMRSESMKK